MPEDLKLNVIITKEKSTSPQAVKLLNELSSELSTRYYDDGVASFGQEDDDVEKSCFVIAWLDKQAVGCGALYPLEGSVGEVKKMYVKIEMRGKGISKMILNNLEESAKNFGYEKIWLETGVLQPEAIGLYEKDGYRRIKNYGIYENNPLSICFEKTL